MQELENEKQTADARNIELISKLEELEAVKTSLRNDLREIKMKESQLMSDYADLEDENVTLQKQLMQLKQAQVDFETMKYENKHLSETVDELNHEVEALVKLKEIGEKNLTEALEQLQREREEKTHLKKELDQRISSESVHALQALASLGLNNFSSDQSSIGLKFDEMYLEEHDNPTLKKIEADFVSNHAREIKKPDVPAEQSFIGDLFSEIHVSEVKKLENLVEKLEMEKNLLEKSLEDANTRVEHSKKQVKISTEKVIELESNLKSLSVNYTNFATESLDLQDLVKTFTTYESAINQVLKLQNDINQTSTSNVDPSRHNPDTDIVIRRLETEVEDKSDMVKELQSVLDGTCDVLRQVSKDLSHLYCMMCTVRSEAPNKNLLEFDKSKSETLQDTSYVACRRLCDFVTSQILSMVQVMTTIVEADKEKQLNEPQTEGMVELKDQNTKLKTMLATKREQIATLRNVLKSNKTVAETALTSLKQRFEKDKLLAMNEVQRLRSEVQTLKEEKATFASLRASFAQRCDEYLTQLDEQQLRILKAEEEKKTLNSLLRMAMQQKMALNSRLEDLENNRELRKPRPSNAYRGSFRSAPRPGFVPFQFPNHLPLEDHFMRPHQRRDYWPNDRPIRLLFFIKLFIQLRSCFKKSIFLSVTFICLL